MIPIDQALALYDQLLAPLPVEHIDAVDALHRVLAQPAAAAADQPRFDQSAMDGYAFSAAALEYARPDAPCRLPVAAHIPAGAAPATQAVPGGHAVRILTGAPLPPGVDTVIPQERATLEDGALVFTTPYPARLNVRWRGEELHAGDGLAAAGARVTPGLLAALINAGCTRLAVHRRPRLRLLVSGDEVRPPGQALAPGQITDSNGPYLCAVLQRWGLAPPQVEYLADEPDAVRRALEQALREADIVISTGGASVGDRDYLPASAEALGVRRVFWKVAQKPGKPMYFGLREQPDGLRVFLGLPGNPGAVLVGVALHLRRIVDRLEGARPALPRWASATTTAELERDGQRTRLLRMQLHFDQGRVLLSPLPHQDSHMLSNLASADVLARVEAGAGPLAAGQPLEWIALP